MIRFIIWRENDGIGSGYPRRTQIKTGLNRIAFYLIDRRLLCLALWKYALFRLAGSSFRIRLIRFDGRRGLGEKSCSTENCKKRSDKHLFHRKTLPKEKHNPQAGQGLRWWTSGR